MSEEEINKKELTEEDVIRYLEECNESQDILGFCYIPEIVCSKILELYNKEKEENKKLNYARNWYFEHFTSEACTPEQLHKILRFDYISKDKIREKIDEINDEKLNYSEDEYYLENEIKGYAIDKLKELLEE